MRKIYKVLILAAVLSGALSLVGARYSYESTVDSGEKALVSEASALLPDGCASEFKTLAQKKPVILLRLMVE